MISFDEETLYELADRDYGLDVWALAKPCGLRNARKRGAWQQPNACRDRRNRRQSPKTPRRNKDGRRTESLETSPRQADCRNLPREALPPNNR